MKLLWKYCVPIIFFLLGLSTLLGEPTEPANRYLPVALGDYQLIGSAVFFFSPCFLRQQSAATKSTLQSIVRMEVQSILNRIDELQTSKSVLLGDAIHLLLQLRRGRA